MGTIRRQSIFSSVIVYTGFALGGVTNFVLARELDPDQYGLINGMFLAVGTIMFFLGNLGMPIVIGKFYPYYKDHLGPRKNDLLTWVLLIGLTGFGLTALLGFLFKGAVIQFYKDKSAALASYYYWIFPFGLGITVYTLLEAYAWQLRRSVLTTYLREIQLRLLTLTLVLLYLFHVLGGFGIFVKLYAFNYLVIGLILLVVLIRTGHFHLVFTPSRVTQRFFSKMKSMAMMNWVGGLVFNVAFYFAQIIIAAEVAGGLTAVGIYTLAQYIGSLVQAPQRGILSASTGPLSQAWKDKDYGRIARIYRRSSITQLIFSVGMFVLLWINFTDGITTFHFKSDYLLAMPVFLYIGLARIIDMGTGVNNQIIATSTFWRFDMFSGLILVTLTLPLNYWLARRLGIVGPAIADLFTFTVYNAIRCLFLYRKFKLQPFTIHSLYTVLLGLAGFLVCHFLFSARQGIGWLFLRSLTFLAVYVSGVLFLGLSEDILPVWLAIKGRVSRLKNTPGASK